jgi:2-hydroxychromene-2-carboxylate isomerase
MKHVTFYLDFVSPYAWLAFARMPEALRGLNYHVDYRPVLLGALLQQNANPGPAGIPAKRAWTYRHVSWLGHAHGVPLQMPARHPFRPLPLLRLALAHGQGGSINRFVAESVFRHVWQGGEDALEPARLEALKHGLAGQLNSQADEEAVKQWLRGNTDQAARAGVFGVPAWEVDGRVFWGLDGLPMLRAYLQGDAWFDLQWEAAGRIESGLGG